MTVELMNAELDAHDALLKACLEGSLSFEHFMVAYGDFPMHLQARSKHAGAERLAGASANRITFHARVASVLSGLMLVDQQLEGAGLGPRVGLMRLRDLIARYPSFEVNVDG